MQMPKDAIFMHKLVSLTFSVDHIADISRVAIRLLEALQLHLKEDHQSLLILNMMR